MDRDRAAATEAEAEARGLQQRLEALDRAAKDVAKCNKLVDEAAVEVRGAGPRGTSPPRFRIASQCCGRPWLRRVRAK